MHPDPTRRERTPSPPPPPLPVAELHLAAREGALAVSNAAVGSAAPVRPTSNVRYLEDDERDPPRFEPIDVIFAEASSAPALRQIALPKKSSCCGSHRLGQPAAQAVKDERSSAHHAMCHATQRSSHELHQELTQSLARGDAPPMIAIYGSLNLVLDELAVFRATLALAKAFLAPDPAHAELISQATRVDEVAGELPTETLVHARHRLDEALRRTTKGPQLELSRDRSLVERRKIAETQALGERRLRASLRVSSGPEIPCFLPISSAASLPLARTFSAVLVARVRVAPDPNMGVVALEVLAVGRPVKESVGQV